MMYHAPTSKRPDKTKGQLVTYQTGPTADQRREAAQAMAQLSKAQATLDGLLDSMGYDPLTQARLARGYDQITDLSATLATIRAAGYTS